MAAPTPVSGYLHAAAMVKAGIYPGRAPRSGFRGLGPWRATVINLGLLSMILAGWRASVPSTSSSFWRSARSASWAS